MPEPSAFKFGVAVEKLRRQKSPGINQISTEFIKAGESSIRFETQKLINSIWSKKELPVEWKESIIFKRMLKQIAVILESYHFCQLHEKFYPTSCSQG